MIQVLAFDDHMKSGLLTQPPCFRERRRPPNIFSQVLRKLRSKSRIRPGRIEFALKLIERGHECFRNVAAAVVSKAAPSIGASQHGFSLLGRGEGWYSGPVDSEQFHSLFTIHYSLFTVHRSRLLAFAGYPERQERAGSEGDCAERGFRG